MSDGANTLVTLGSGDKHLKVWTLGKDAGTSTLGPALSMKHAPLSFQCKNGCNGESGAVVLAISKSGAYVWHLKTQSEEEVSPSKITCKVNEDETALQSTGNARKSRVSIIAARLQDLDAEKKMKALISYGSTDHPQFTLVDITIPGEDIVINAEEANSILENGITGKGVVNCHMFLFLILFFAFISLALTFAESEEHISACI